MTLHIQSKTKFIELDQELLSSPYQVQTNWIVIAGAPSAGKTTLIELMTEKGFRTAPEPARLHMDQEFAKGRTIQDIRKDQKKLQHTFLKLQLKMESQLNPYDFIFLDRGIPDQFSYCRIAGVDPNKFVKECFHKRYRTVFILAPLPFDKDGYRDREAEIVDYFDEWITRDYQALGYKSIRVPVLPTYERLAFILDTLRQSNLI
jgi:predicted ATPase